MTEFLGTERYEVVKRLGAGGMGVVYEVIDRERSNRRVALKVLQRSEPQSVSRLKREFRALADVRHPNLAALYELTADAQSCFFTLELIEGVECLTWVRPQTPSSDARAAADTTVRTPVIHSRDAPDIERLTAVFAQLAQGVAALHAMGQLHRDLKPSNVMVTTEGRVVILDFGLVSDVLGADRSLSELDGLTIVGTAAYMAPEQAQVAALSPASDWYAVGVMLFQALTGRLPFAGSAMQVMLDKQQRPAPTVFDLSPDAPRGLGTLCGQLLRREPSERPTASQVLEQLGAPLTEAPLPKTAESMLLGRESERAAIRSAFDAVQSTRVTQVLRVLGDSGIGKTAMVRQCLAELEAAGAVVLAGRCSERESVPFKALDGIVDALARYLVSLSPERVDAVLPREAAALAHMFPALQRAAAFRDAPTRDIRDLAEHRRRAIAGLRELLARLGDRRPLVGFIDDVQWGDVDSEEVLNEMLKGSDAPAFLLIVAARSKDDAFRNLPVSMTDLVLGPLPFEVCAALAQRSAPAERAEMLARESQGNPFLLMQLAHFGGSTAQTLSQLVAGRLTQLRPSERRVLEVIAVAGAPVLERVAVATAGLAAHELDAVQVLKSARLVRAVSDERLEPWHDRLREVVLAQLTTEQRLEWHRALAEILVQLPQPTVHEVELTATHLASAGLRERATVAWLEAAMRARTQLAFDGAAALYERALTQLPEGDPRRSEAWVALGEVLSFAGRGAKAAAAYNHASAGPDALARDDRRSRLEFRRRAAEQLLRAGHIDEGLVTIRAVLKEVGMTLAPTPWHALMALAFRRLHVMLRGLAFARRSEASVRPEDLARIDVCWSVSVGLGMVDTIRGASFQTRQLLLALEAGEPFRVSRALAAEAAFVATQGARAGPRSRALIDRARALAVERGEASLLGLVDFCDGLTRFLVGQWGAAQALSSQAEQQFASIGSPVSWEAASARLFSVWSLFYLGEIAELSRRIPALLQEAESRGDLYAVTSLKSGLANVSLLAAGDPTGARSAVREVMSRWSATSFHFQHYWALLSEGLIDLYEDKAADGWARTEAAWPTLKQSQLLRIQNVRIEATYLRARLALATGRRSEAAKAGRQLERERIGWATGFALLIQAALSPSPFGAGASLSDALAQFDADDMRLFAAATRLRLASTQGPPLQSANERAAQTWMTAQGIVDPHRMAAVLVPSLECLNESRNRAACS